MCAMETPPSMEIPETVSYLDGYGVSIFQGLPLEVQVARERGRLDVSASPIRVTMSGHSWGRHVPNRTNDSEVLLGEMGPSEDEPAARHDGAAQIPDLLKTLFLREEQESQAAVSQSWRDGQEQVPLPQPSDTRVKIATNPPMPQIPLHNEISAVDEVMEGRNRHLERAQIVDGVSQLNKPVHTTTQTKEGEKDGEGDGEGEGEGEGEAPSSNAISSHVKYLSGGMISSSPPRPSNGLNQQSVHTAPPSIDADHPPLSRPSNGFKEQSVQAAPPSIDAEVEVCIEGLQLEESISPDTEKRQIEAKPRRRLSSKFPSTTEASEPRAQVETPKVVHSSAPASITAQKQPIHPDDAGEGRFSLPPNEEHELGSSENSDGLVAARVASLMSRGVDSGPVPTSRMMRTASSPEPRRMSAAGLTMSMSPPPALLKKSLSRRRDEERRTDEKTQTRTPERALSFGGSTRRRDVEDQRDAEPQHTPDRMVPVGVSRSAFRPTNPEEDGAGLDMRKLANRIKTQEEEYHEAKKRYEEANAEYERVKFFTRRRESARKNLRLVKDTFEQCQYDLTHSRRMYQKLSKASYARFTR